VSEERAAAVCVFDVSGVFQVGILRLRHRFAFALCGFAREDTGEFTIIMIVIMMIANSNAAAGFALGSMACWGVSDFIGGYATRRANAFVLTTITHLSGTLLMLVLALASHAEFPHGVSILWALAAGASGGGALAIFYRALAQGRMGLTAPVAAVLGAAIPVAFAMTTEGLPGAITTVGFVLAVFGIWLISRTEGGAKPEGIGAAMLSGVGFAGYFLFIKQAGLAGGSPFWLAGTSRSAAFVLTAAIVALAPHFRGLTSSGVSLGVIAGFLDISGSVLFIRASQSGRLDSAVVISSLYPAITVLLARLFLHEHFSRWKVVGMAAALLAVPLIAVSSH